MTDSLPRLASHFLRLQNKLEIREIGITDPKQGATVCAKYARNVFDMADTADRSNTADAQTVKTFMAAVCFLDTMNYFQKELGAAGAALLAETETKRKHAAYRASVIAKALKSGEPVPPPKGDSSADADIDAMFAALPAPPGVGGGAAGGFAGGGLGLPPPAPAPAPAPYLPPAPAPAPYTPRQAPAPAPVPAPAFAAAAGGPVNEAEASRHAKFAVSALQVSCAPMATSHACATFMRHSFSGSSSFNASR